MMDGVVHKFYISSESDINNEIKRRNSYNSFSKNHEKYYIEDNFIQLLLMNKYFIDVPTYNYNNTKLSVGLNTLSGTVIKNVQIPQFLNKLDVFESEINDEKNTSGIKLFKCTKEEVLNELYKLRILLKKALDSNMCVYHIGI